MQNPNIQNYLEDFSVESLEELSPFLQDAFSRVRYAFNSRLNSKDCSFTVDFAKEELARFVSVCLKQEDKVWEYKNNALHLLNSLSLTPEEFDYRFKKAKRDIDSKIPDFVLWYYRYLKEKYDVRVQYTVYITRSR